MNQELSMSEELMVTYELDGKQFVAVLSGTGNGRVFGFALDAAGGKP